MEEEKVVLDRKSFEALAVDSRIRILKSLKQRRKTLSEIATEVNMSVSGVKEHLETLEGADLVRKMDDGHKWKYYELTKKGSDLMAPKELRVWVVLSIAMIALVVSMLSIMPSLSMVSAPSALQTGETVQNNPTAGTEPLRVMAAAYQANDSGYEAASMKAANAYSIPTGAADTTTQQQDDGLPMLVGGISILTILSCLGILAMNRLKNS
jgi:predicted transcriptional regulator